MSTCRRRRHLPLEHVLIAGGAQDLEAIKALLALLPSGAYGQVFLEDEESDIPDDDALATIREDLAPPPRMTITRLTASGSPAPAASPVLATRGVLLAEAVTAWSTEWIPQEPAVERIVSVWIGGRGSEAVDALCEAFPHPVERL